MLAYTTSRSRDALRPRFANRSRPLKKEGARDPQERAQATLKRGRRRPSREGAGDPQERAQATLKRGRREDRVHAAPAVSCAILCFKKAHTSIQVKRKHSGLPCAVALRIISCSPRRSGSFATVADELLRRLDASVEASGPHDFTVRVGTTRQPCRHVHRIPPRVS
jgi:hypothetical protein